MLDVIVLIIPHHLSILLFQFMVYIFRLVGLYSVGI